jgi:hypothetical protein
MRVRLDEHVDLKRKREKERKKETERERQRETERDRENQSKSIAKGNSPILVSPSLSGMEVSSTTMGSDGSTLFEYEDIRQFQSNEKAAGNPPNEKER